MIPKTIHFCWLSDDPYPRKIRKCIDTWKKVMPDYEIKIWNTHNFDINSVPMVREAYEKHKWAFAADYIRLYALYHEGGIYLDSDVKIFKPFDDLLHHRFVSSLEYHTLQIEKDGAMDLIDQEGHRVKDELVSGIMIQAAVMASEPGHEFLADVMKWYADEHFVHADGTMKKFVLAPIIYARIAEKYGFLYLDKDQQLDNDMMIYRSEIFAGNKHEITPASYAVHLCAHSWHPSVKEKILKFLGKKL